jgi:hypothetical protein
MDRLKREGNPPVGQLASPVPQYKRPGSTDYDPVEGQHGAPFATLKDASGAVVSPATEATLAQVQTELALVKTELATIKANQLSGDQKVQLSGNIETRETIRPRAVLTEGELSVTLKTVPNGAKGVVAQLVVYGISGTWEADGGVSFRMAHYSSGRSAYHFIYDSVNSSSAKDIVVKMYPGFGSVIPTGSIVKLTNSWSNVNDILEERIGFRIDMAGGTFSEGQGVDCELRVRWLY